MTPSTYSTAQQIYVDLGVDTEAIARELCLQMTGEIEIGVDDGDEALGHGLP